MNEIELTDMNDTFLEIVELRQGVHGLDDNKNYDITKISGILKIKEQKKQSNEYDILCYGLVSEEYDIKLRENYKDMIERCEKLLKRIDHDDNNVKLSELSDDEIILLVELGFSYYIYEYIGSEYYKKYTTLVVNRLNRIYNQEKYSYFFSIFNVIYQEFESKKYFKWLL